MPEIGQALREARMRARIDVSEIEAQTKIRAKYLRALENEEWDLLPGPTFVKSFLRTYGQALGLDGKALVEEYRLNYERPNETLEPIVPTSSKSPRGGGGASAGARARAAYANGPSRLYAIAIGAVSIIVVLLIVGLLTSGSSNNPPTTSTPSHTAKDAHRPSGAPLHHAPANDLVAVSVQPTAPVYVCLISATGRKLIPGVILQPGTPQPTYRSHRFLLTLGNASVKLLIDGSPRAVPASGQAIGYSIAKATGRHTLAAGELPSCR
jgi:cytoskeleton protein RodZ